MAYDSERHMFTIYSTDSAMIGSHTITLSASLADYPQVRSSEPDVTTTIEVLHQCSAPRGIRAPDQVDPPAYHWMPDGVSFTITPFVTQPAGCDVVYSCHSIAGIDRNVQCNIPGVTTFDGVYDGDDSDGTFTFESIDEERFMEGEYVVTITGTTGIDVPIVTYTTFKLTLGEPCASAELSLSYSPFSDVNYYLMENQH